MPNTVPASFDKFRQNIEPPTYQREIATKRKDSIISLLENDFTILNAFATGSLPKFTAVTGHADLDIMVVLHYGKHIKEKQPSQVLKAVRDCLAEYRTNVRRNGQAITLSYKTWPDVDIVPVARVINDDGAVSRYDVPDMNTETWLPSQPVRHANELRDRNKSFGVEFKRIIKMIKWWNHQHSSYLQSYHIEVLALHALVGKFNSYSWDVYKFFDSAIGLVDSPLYHHVGYVDAYLDWNKRQEAIKRLTTARELASEAWYRTDGNNNDHEGAIKIYQRLFGDKYPNYG